MITISASLLNGFLSVAASEVTWLEQTFCNTPVHAEHCLLATGARELSEKIHEFRIDYQTRGEEGHSFKALSRLLATAARTYYWLILL